jgi:hypothetical protein
LQHNLPGLLHRLPCQSVLGASLLALPVLQCLRHQLPFASLWWLLRQHWACLPAAGAAAVIVDQLPASSAAGLLPD